ncbi:SDR family oxidoreductase [Micromonospora sp. NPDC049523]|uniref:SDR family NAD(P)-dependent oxidoreductase n=1 Tax=Micromonospora sp. NPDC049523 TaxID=3155921 RepID=UPI0034390FAF
MDTWLPCSTANDEDWEAMTSSDVAVVAGAAGDIGRAICQILTGRGLAVVGLDIVGQPEGLATAGWHIVDLSDGDFPEDLGPQLCAAGPVRHVFHVIGGSDADELREPDPVRIPMEVFRRTVALNLYSAYGVIRGTVEELRKTSGDRSYTLFSSLNALGGYGAPGYSSSKAALHGLVRSLAVPLSREAIRINAVALGTTRTENYVRLAGQAGREVDFDRLGAALVPRGSVLEPAEAATAAVALGLENPAVTGTVLVVDAGQSLMRPRARS